MTYDIVYIYNILFSTYMQHIQVGEPDFPL